MSLQLFQFLTSLFHLVQSVAQWRDQKAFLGALIPVAQFGWKWWRERSHEYQKTKLREKVGDLQHFLVALENEPGESPRTEKLRADTKAEREEAIVKLYKIACAAGLEAARVPNRLQRWFLFYAPTGVASLVLHILFYLMLPVAVLIPVSIGMLIQDRDPETAYGLIGCAIFAAIFLMTRSVALAVDGVGSPNRVERWLLLFRPDKSSGWIIRVLFYLSLVLTSVALAGLFSTDAEPEQDDYIGKAALIALGFIPPFLLRSLAAALERARGPNRIERWLLLYRPSRGVGWIVHTLFYIGLTATFMMLIAFVAGTAKHGQDLAELGSALAGWLVILAVFRAWAVRFDPLARNSTVRRRFQNFFLLYAPAKRGVWTLHILFYVSLLFLISALVAIPLLGRGDERTLLALVSTVVSMGFAAFVIREWSRGFEPEQQGIQARRWRALLRPASRSIAWVPRIVLFCDVFFLPLALSVAFENENGDLTWRFLSWNWGYILRVLAPMIMIAIAADGWATSYWPSQWASLPISSSAGLGSKLRHALLLYIPSPPAGWTPHVIFYLAGILLFAAMIRPSLLLLSRHLDRTVLEVMLLILFACARGWARSYGNARHATA